MSEESVRRSMDAFESDTEATGIDLSSMRLNQFSLERLGELIANPRLRYLGLNCIGLDSSIVDYLGRAIESGNSLVSVSLPGVRIDDRCAPRLITALGKHSSIEYVDLRSTQIGNLTALAIAKMLKQSPRMSTLYLDNTLIGDAGANALIAGIRECQTFSDISLFKCPISRRGVKSFAELSCDRPDLIVCGLHGHNEATGKERIRRARMGQMRNFLTDTLFR